MITLLLLGFSSIHTGASPKPCDPLFLELIIQFLATPILDNKGTNYMSTKKGIPQGSVFSPILMNLVLHELDTFALSVCEKRRLKYGRYADDCTFGVRANSDCVARDTLSQFSQFLKTELGGLSNVCCIKTSDVHSSVRCGHFIKFSCLYA